MQTCKYCLKEQPAESFEVCRIVGGKIYRRLKCRDCKRAGMIARRTVIRKWLDEYKQTLSCSRCGFADFRALEFHHHTRGEKAANVADMVRSGKSIKTIKQEIDKCVVLCSNCHQIEHFRR